MKNLLRLAASISIGIFLGSVIVSAQSAVQSQPANSTATKPTDLNLTSQKMVQSCPISLRAQHGADGGIRNIDKAKPEGVAQLLHLILTSKDSRQIVEARLRVRGVSPKGHLTQADTADGANATRSVSVHLTPSGENEVTGRVWIPGLSAVLEVELNGVTFAGGSMQRFSAADGCRFTPDHLMLIANDSR